MGRCQGRTCGPIAARLIAAEANADLESVGAFTARHPIKPVPLKALAGQPEPAR